MEGAAAPNARRLELEEGNVVFGLSLCFTEYESTKGFVRNRITLNAHPVFSTVICMGVRDVHVDTCSDSRGMNLYH